MRTESLGHGLFLLDYDPHADTLEGADGEKLATTLIADGVSHQRSLRLVHPQPHPRWFAASPSTGLAATVSEETDELILVRRDGSFQRVNVDDGPSDCAVFGSGSRIAVSHRFHPTLCIVDAGNGSILKRLELGRFQVRLAVSPDEKTLAVALAGAQRGIQFISLPDLSPKEFVPLDFAPDWIVFGRSAAELIVTDRIGRFLHRLQHNSAAAPTANQDEKSHPEGDTSGWVLDEQPVPLSRPVVTLCRSPSGEQVVFTATAPFVGEVPPISANHYIEDSFFHLDLNAWQITQSYTTHRGGSEQDYPGMAEHGVSPLGLAALGDSLVIAFAGTNELAMSSFENGASFLFRTFEDEPLDAPHGIADLGEGYFCVSSPANGTIGVFDPQASLSTLISLSGSDEELAESNPNALNRRRGERTFYRSARAGLACQSCHLHSDTDHCMHSIGEDELVGVLSVHGIAGTAPYLRDASHFQLRDLHNVAVEVYRDYPDEVDWDRGDVLAAYMNGLALTANWRMLEPYDVDRLRAGMDAFVKAKCVYCHVPPAMTNLGQHPCKLLFPEYGEFIDSNFDVRNFLDTPSLRSVSCTPPYLHNGRAETLDAIFRKHNPAGRHGDTKSLSETEFRDLLYFLENL
jgi:hypothetical protein